MTYTLLAANSNAKHHFVVPRGPTHNFMRAVPCLVLNGNAARDLTCVFLHATRNPRRSTGHRTSRRSTGHHTSRRSTGHHTSRRSTGHRTSRRSMDTAHHVTAPDTAHHVAAPDTIHHVAALDTAPHVTALDTAHHVAAPDTAHHVAAPDTIHQVAAPDTAHHVATPDTAHHGLTPDPRSSLSALASAGRGTAGVAAVSGAVPLTSAPDIETTGSNCSWGRCTRDRPLFIFLCLFSVCTKVQHR